tara:strand:- start:5075 stop:5500 length:426 start_codon:yes stop_codon:yes gene_type:complete
MPLLHFRISKASEIINLDKALHGQNFTFKRAIVVKNSASTIKYKGGLTVQLDFLSGGLEIMSNMNDNELNIPFTDNTEVADVRYNINFASEDINRSFKVSVLNYNKSNTTPLLFNTAGTGGELFYIDMYFEFSELYDYNRY